MENAIKRSRILYIIEATLEYLISLLVTGSFLATLTEHLGFSDSLTGILSSVISLGCLFQLLSITVRRTRVKSFVFILSIINQLFFTLLYVIPLFDFSKQAKTVLFIVFIFVAYFLYNIAHPKKISWLMSLVDNSKRGVFTANKEIISLISGMIFSFLMGILIDNCLESGKTKTAFIVSAAVMLTLMILHSLSLFFTVEKEATSVPRKTLKQSVLSVLQNKKILGVTFLFILYNIAHYASIPFHGTYMIKELGFSLAFVSVLTMCGSVARVVVSKLWGRYADRRSFGVMMEKCLYFMAFSFICVIFAVPSNGKIMFALYYICHGISMGGISSALMNMIFDYAPYESRADSLAISQALAGVVGFVTTLCVSPLVAYVQYSGNVFLGIPVYAQQLVTVISLMFIVLGIIYVRRIVKSK